MMWIEKFKKLIKEDGFTLAIVLIIVGVYTFLRTPGDGFSSMAVLEEQLHVGTPTIVEFYSNNCSVCLVSKPDVDQMEKDLAGQVQVLRLNIKDKVSGTLAAQWGVRGVPTFFVLDTQGMQRYVHVGKPDTQKLTQIALGPASQ